MSSAPAQFKTMAEGFENALNEVDSRNTPAGVKPAIATTLETLASITGVTGQPGFRHRRQRRQRPIRVGRDPNGSRPGTPTSHGNGVWRLNSEIYTGRKWVDGRRIYMQVREYKNLANNSRTSPGISNMYTLLDAHVITQGKNGSMQPYLATDTYWHSGSHGHTERDHRAQRLVEHGRHQRLDRLHLHRGRPGMTESIISALIGTGGVGRRRVRPVRGHMGEDTQRQGHRRQPPCSSRRNANSTKAPETDSSCGCGTGNLWTRYGGARLHRHRARPTALPGQRRRKGISMR